MDDVSASPEDGVWATTLVTSEVNEEITLAGALGKVGAHVTVMAALIATAAEGDPVPFSFGDDEIAGELAGAFSKLGATSADVFYYTISADELAGALCSAAGRPGLHEAARRLLGHTEDGRAARAGVRQCLIASLRDDGPQLTLLLGLAVRFLDGIDHDAKSMFSCANAAVRIASL